MLETEMGMLTINGKELHIKRLTLDKKETDIEGMIQSFTYSDLAKYKKSKDRCLEGCSNKNGKLYIRRDQCVS